MPWAPEESLNTADRLAHALHMYLCQKKEEKCPADDCDFCYLNEIVGFPVLTKKEASEQQEGTEA